MIYTVIDTKTRREYQIEARSGGENALKCPVCSDERKNKRAKSMTFNAIKGIGHCHNDQCQANFVSKDRDNTRISPVDRSYFKPKWVNHTQLSDRVIEWFKSRGISQTTLLDFKISEGKEWMPQTQKEQNTIQFNYFRDGELVNVKFRDGAKNFKLVSKAELIFYNLDAIKGQKGCYIVEGEIDTLSFHEIGVKNVISVPNGATRGNARLEYMDNCWEYFVDMEWVCIATDNDEAGRALRDELARRIGKYKCKTVDYGEYKDANEVLQKDRLHLSEIIKAAKDYPIEGLFRLSDLATRVLDLKKRGLKPGDGISIDHINNHITYVPGYVTLITGVPNHGKGEFLDQIIIDLAHLHGWPFGIYSPENRPMELHVSKLAAKCCGQSFDHLTNDEILLFISDFSNRLFFIEPPDDITLGSILDYGSTLVKKYGIKGFVIDPWNKLDHQYTGSETQYISDSLDRIVNWAYLNGVHVFLVAHPAKLQKDRETKKIEVPGPYNVSGSAHWYNKIDNCITVYRNFFEDGSSTTDIHIQKVKFKHWGKQGVVTTNYDTESGRYYVVGYQNRRSYLNTPSPEIPFDSAPVVKPNTQFKNFYEIDREDDDEIISHEDAPF